MRGHAADSVGGTLPLDRLPARDEPAAHVFYDTHLPWLEINIRPECRRPGPACRAAVLQRTPPSADRTATRGFCNLAVTRQAGARRHESPVTKVLQSFARWVHQNGAADHLP